MNLITITYSPHRINSTAEQQVIVVDGEKHDVGALLERCRKRIFPDVEPPVVDAVFNAIMKRKKTEQPAAPTAGAEDYKRRPAPVGVRETSRAALDKHRASGKLTKQQAAIVSFMRLHGEKERATGWTRQELAKATKLGINVVCGRVNELLHEPHEVLVETQKRKCSVTWETAMALGLA